MSSRLDEYTVEELRCELDKAKSFKEFLRVLGYNSVSGRLYKDVKDELRSMGVDVDSFKSKYDKPTKLSREEVLNERFIKGFPYSKAIKGWISTHDIQINSGSKEQCGLCPQTNIWNGIDLVMQLDHIDGDNANNLPENLRFICPNCHTQTETFGARNKEIVVNECIDCNKVISPRSTRCGSCAMSKNNRKLYKFDPSKEELEKMVVIDRIPLTKVGKYYNVSDNAVRKRCIKLGIDYKK